MDEVHTSVESFLKEHINFNVVKQGVGNVNQNVKESEEVRLWIGSERRKYYNYNIVCVTSYRVSTPNSLQKSNLTSIRKTFGVVVSRLHQKSSRSIHYVYKVIYSRILQLYRIMSTSPRRPSKEVTFDDQKRKIYSLQNLMTLLYVYGQTGM